MSYFTPQGDVVGYDKSGNPIFGPDAVQPSSSGQSFIGRTLTAAAKPPASSGGFLDSIASAITSGASALVSAVMPKPAQLVTSTSRTPAWVLPGALIAAAGVGVFLVTRKPRRNPARRARQSRR